MDFIDTKMGRKFIENDVPKAIGALTRIAAALERLSDLPKLGSWRPNVGNTVALVLPNGEVTSLTPKELFLLTEALDSHVYWQLSDEKYRRSGEVVGPGSDTLIGRRKIGEASMLASKLQIVRAKAKADVSDDSEDE